MMSSQNKITLDFSENPDLQAALGGHAPGDRVTIEVTVMVTAVDDQRFEGDVEEITADSEDGEKSTAEVNSKEPVMVMMAKKAGKYQKPAEPADDTDAESAIPEDNAK